MTLEHGSRSLYTIYQKTLNEWNLTEMWTLFQKLIIYEIIITIDLPLSKAFIYLVIQ